MSKCRSCGARVTWAKTINGTFWYEDTPVDVLEALAQGGQDAES